MLGYIIVAIVCFILGMIAYALLAGFITKEKELTEQQIAEIEKIIENDVIRTKNKINKILEVFKS